MLRDARSATAKEHPRAQVIQRPGLLEVLADELENLLQPQRHDPAQMLEVDGLKRQAEFVGDRNRLALGGLVEKAVAVLDLELLGAAERHFQTIRQIVRDMIAADREHARVLDDPVGINDIVGRPAADVDDQRAEFLLLVRQHQNLANQ